MSIEFRNVAFAHKSTVVPAKAGIQCLRRDNWVPAFAGMTIRFDDAFHRVIARELPHP